MKVELTRHWLEIGFCNQPPLARVAVWLEPDHDRFAVLDMLARYLVCPSLMLVTLTPDPEKADG